MCCGCYIVFCSALKTVKTSTGVVKYYLMNIHAKFSSDGHFGSGGKRFKCYVMF